jgi:hypothetical protein
MITVKARSVSGQQGRPDSEPSPRPEKGQTVRDDGQEHDEPQETPGHSR